MIGRLTPGGVLTMPNWFLLTEAMRDTPPRDWAAFARPNWRGATLTCAHRLAAQADLDVT